MGGELDLGHWCILRTSASATLSVLSALADQGFTVWSPVEHRIARTPRTRASYDKATPILPSYVFATIERIDELASLAALQLTNPRFTIFRHAQGIPLIADSELSPLRDEEARSQRLYTQHKRKGMKHPTFDKGSPVQATSGGFEGLSGIVEDSQGQYTLVSYPGFHSPIKIASLLLLSGNAINRQSQDTAAQQAA